MGIDLERHLDIRHPEQFKTYALLGTLIVVYRYAEALGHHMVIFDMTTGGPHVSHKHDGFHFDYETGAMFNPVNQANVISDMLRVGRAMNERLHAFRLGFHFDFFNNKAAIDTVRTFDDFQRIDGRSPAEFRSLRGHRLSSMHLGVRYEFESADYRASTRPGGASGAGTKARRAIRVSATCGAGASATGRSASSGSAPASSPPRRSGISMRSTATRRPWSAPAPWGPARCAESPASGYPAPARNRGWTRTVQAPLRQLSKRPRNSRLLKRRQIRLLLTRISAPVCPFMRNAGSAASP